MMGIQRLIAYKLIALFMFAVVGTSAVAKDVCVKGYYKSNGTYVQPSVRTSPNNTLNDNYGTRGNVNPYTGQMGTKPRDEDLGYGNSRGKSNGYGSDNYFKSNW